MSPLASPEGLAKALSGDDTTYLNGAIGVIERYCGWHVSPVIESTIKLEGHGGTELGLPTMALVEVLSVTNDGVAIDINDIDFSTDGTLSLRSGIWSRRLGAITVVVRHGFEQAPELASVAYAMALRALANKRGKAGSSVDAVNSKFATYAGGGAANIVPFQTEYKVMDQYKLRVV